MNNMLQESIQQTPCFANFGWHPQSAVNVLLSVDMPTVSATSAFPWIKQQREIIQMVRDCVMSAQARQSFYTDQHRRSRRSVSSWGGSPHAQRLSFWWSDQRTTFSKVATCVGRDVQNCTKVSSTALKLSLPPGCRAHPFFNVSALKRYHHNMIPERVQPPPPPVSHLDGHTRYLVERVLNHRQRHGIWQYLVQWTGLGIS